MRYNAYIGKNIIKGWGRFIRNNYWCILVLVGLLVLGNIKIVKADSYGGNEQEYNLVVDKKVRRVGKVEYKDNIWYSEDVFSDGDYVEFGITIENKGKDKINNVKATDILPEYTGIIFHPGEYKNSTRTVEWLVGDLKPGEWKNYVIRVKVTKTPTNHEEYIKQINSVEAKGDQASDSDKAIYFLAKKILPVTGAGIEMMGIGASLVGATISLYIRKKSRGF